MVIEKNKVVVVHYKLQEDDLNGPLVEETTGKAPLAFIYGLGMMIPDFEANLSGKKAGDEAQFGIKAENAYGVVNPEAIVDIPKSVFVIDGKEATDLLQVGKQVPMQDQSGNPMNGIVVGVAPESVKVDFNHPMAGKNLFFTVNVEEVRDATSEELDHGHVHGPGGHQH